jgi:hypothetical protein
MWAIVSTDELSYFEQEGRIVGILIAQQFDQDALDWVFDAWDELHFLSSKSWHIAVPCFRILRDHRPERRDFDVQISNRLREMYGISRKETPVLVLDNFIEEDRQLFLKIGAAERDRKAMFIEIAKFIDERMSQFDYMTRNGAARRHMIDELYNHMMLREVGRTMLKLAPKAASAAARLLRGSH